MKKLSLSIILIAIASLAYTGCKSVAVTNSSRGSSPGQMKQETGSKSAKPFAPGQVKKATGSQSAKPYAPGQQKKKTHGQKKNNQHN